MKVDLTLNEFIEHEMRSCSIDIAGIMSEYVYRRKWGEKALLNGVEAAMDDVRRMM